MKQYLPKELAAALDSEALSVNTKQELNAVLKIHSQICMFEKDRLCSRIDLNAWRILISADAHELWTNPDDSTLKVWTYFGYDPHYLSKIFSAHTFLKVVSLLKDGRGDLRTERAYANYLAGFHQVKTTLKSRLRKDEFSMAIEKHSFLFHHNFSAARLVAHLVETVPLECECDSLIFHILTQRPDIISSAI